MKTQKYYKLKYYKYKNKYLQLLELGLNDLDKVDINDNDTIENISREVYNRDSQDQINKNMNIKAKQSHTFLGFDTPGIDFISKYNQTISDIGLFGQTRATIHPFSKFNKNNFIQVLKPNKNKILNIKTKNQFDNFTDKYGQICKKDNRVYINWARVSKDYRGFYLKPSILDEREIDIPYQGRIFPSWIYYDFKFVDNVVLFVEKDILMVGKKISKPFKGVVLDEYAVESSKFARISDDITKNKFLLIDDIKSFDKFTNKYGKIIEKKNKSYINIDWDKVSRDYEGFYIDKDNNFRINRYYRAFYNNKLYISWWETENIEQGIVYQFK